MDGFRERKAARVKALAFEKNRANGWIKAKCVACSGSGRYDNKGSPRCAACGGSGMAWVRPYA